MQNNNWLFRFARDTNIYTCIADSCLRKYHLKFTKK